MGDLSCWVMGVLYGIPVMYELSEPKSAAATEDDDSIFGVTTLGRYSADDNADAAAASELADLVVFQRGRGTWSTSGVTRIGTPLRLREVHHALR